MPTQEAMLFSLRKPDLQISNPQYFINNSSTGEKEVTITYPQGYTNEYSLDNGVTWLEYKEAIVIKENLTILARSLDGNKVVSSSSIKVSTITSIEEQIELELNIPDSIEIGSDYLLPTSTNAESCVCKINDVEYTSTKDLGVGEYTISCVASNKSGLTKETNKKIIVTEVLGE